MASAVLTKSFESYLFWTLYMHPSLSKSLQESRTSSNCTITNWTVCWQPVRLKGFLLPQFASGQNITHIQHSLHRLRVGYLRASRLLHYLFSIENTHRWEKTLQRSTILPKAPVTPLRLSMLHICVPLADKSQCFALKCFYFRLWGSVGIDLESFSFQFQFQFHTICYYITVDFFNCQLYVLFSSVHLSS